MKEISNLCINNKMAAFIKNEAYCLVIKSGIYLGSIIDWIESIIVFLHTYCRFGLSVIEVEGVVVVVVGLDGVEVEQDVVELLEEEETGGHALTTRNGVTLTCWAADKLQESKMHKSR